MEKDINVLLYSGGLDSFIMKDLFNYDVLIFFETGTDDNAKEKEFIKESLKDDDRLVIINMPLAKFDLKNKVIPHRNSIFALIASNYGNVLHFGFTDGDATKDTDYVFKSIIEMNLNYFALDKHKVAHSAYPYRIEMPIRGYTKTELVKKWIEAPANLNNWEQSVHELWTKSRSCYSGGDKECGMCLSCIRKFVALVNNDIYVNDIFENDPKYFLKDICIEYEEKNISKEELKDMYSASNKLGLSLKEYD